ncbi:hypothetical protein DD607_04905 [Salmonella sp. 3DZ2-4SM]|uniref:ABC transporter permease n=1 Tax=Mammaliicoccus sciuri TaxID=1296 RepID=A0AB37HVG0_MAMSC|nr:hypothetical protein [Mammaliicoccus sciuri]QRN92749.1 hypothetical protein JRU67_14855 [Mammaliicoccus sciuri]RXY94779.1 hypothetical protein DD607_04905 [Salmonella sp. 3DZ2-4SM]
MLEFIKYFAWNWLPVIIVLGVFVIFIMPLLISLFVKPYMFVNGILGFLPTVIRVVPVVVLGSGFWYGIYWLIVTYGMTVINTVFTGLGILFGIVIVLPAMCILMLIASSLK